MDILLQDVLNTRFVVNYRRFEKRTEEKGGGAGGWIKVKVK